MNIIEFSEGLQARMKQELGNLNAGQDEIAKVGKALTFIREIIRELKQFAASYKFLDESEEITFFKEIKPIFLSQYFFYRRVFSIQLFDSFKDVEKRRCNYYQKLERLEQFMNQNQNFYEYCMTGATYLDKHYFTRSGQRQKSVNQDEHFTTRYDTKLAKVLANELLKKYILTALQRSQTETTGLGLNWTTHKAWLIELVYALHSMEVFNKGAADIKLIASTFENCFNINLGNYYRVIQEIRLRKSGQTNFLDQLKEKLKGRLNEYE